MQLKIILFFIWMNYRVAHFDYTNHEENNLIILIPHKTMIYYILYYIHTRVITCLINSIMHTNIVSLLPETNPL